MRSLIDRGRARGTATVEAVVALPVLVLLFISVQFLRDLSTARHEARSLARTCAWLYSANNCEIKPAGCESVLEDANLVGFSDANVMGATVGLEGLGSVGEFVDNAFDALLEAVFGKAAAAHVARQVARPVLFGGKTASVAGDFHIACNIQSTTIDGMAKDAWGKLVPF